MSKQRIIVLVGLKGAGKTTAARYFSGRGAPTVETTANTLRSVRDLLAAGQKLVVADGVTSFEGLSELRHEFPGAVEIVAIVAGKRLRHRRILADAEQNLSEGELVEFDRIEIEEMGAGKMLGVADEYIVNEETVGELYDKISAIIR